MVRYEAEAPEVFELLEGVEDAISTLDLDPGLQRELLNAFRDAIHGQATDAFARLLADDVALTADGGGRVAAVLETLAGPVDVLEFVGSRLAEYWGELDVVDSELNAGAGLEIWDHGELSATVSFDLDDNGLIRYIFIVRNPEKLELLANTPDVLA
jgi:RNA polymerase sigma-70 factor (ECF subfamily)